MFDDQSFLRKTRYQRRQEQSRADRLTRAIRLLELQNGFPGAQVWMRDRMDEVEQGRTAEASYFGTKARAELVFKLFEIRAKAFVELVSSIHLQNAFMVVLENAAREAWREYAGGYIEFLQPASDEAYSVMKAIHKMMHRWIGEGYRRLELRGKSDTEVNTGLPSSKEAMGMTSRVGEPATLIQERTGNATDRRAVELESENGSATPGASDSPQGVTKEAIDSQEVRQDVATWEEIAISFFSEHAIQITVGDEVEIRQYSEVGMADMRTGNPTGAWKILRVLAEGQGVISEPSSAIRQWEKIEKRIQEVRKWLRKRFSIATDPVPFVKNVGYKARFRINCGPSYDR